MIAERVLTPDRRAAALAAYRSPRLLWAIVAFGALLRTIRFLSGRSLWLDEAYLALNVLTKSYGQLAGSLDFDQGAPVGFLWLEKGSTQLFGDSEWAFRVPSFVAGLAALVVFLAVARRYLSRDAAPLAVFLFVVIEPFVYYSNEAKQYGFDVVVTLGLLLLFARYRPGLLTARTGLVLAASGAVAVWLSHPAAFVLAAYGAVAAMVAIRRRDVSELFRQGAVYAFWLASFGVEFVLSIRHIGQLREVASAPSGAHGDSFLKSVVKSLYTIFNDPGQQPRTLVGVTAVAVVVGVAALAQRSRYLTSLLIAPAAVALFAGADHRYPFGVRFILFLLPLAVLLASAGVAALVGGTRGPVRLAVLVALVGSLVLPPGVTAVKNALSPPDQEPAESLIADVAHSWRPGDELYLYPTSQYAFRYYLRCHDCNPTQRLEATLWPFRIARGRSESAAALVPETSSLVAGQTGSQGLVPSFEADLARLRGRSRVWILILHVFPQTPDELLQPIEAAGRQLAVVHRGLSWLLLYDFRRGG